VASADVDSLAVLKEGLEQLLDVLNAAEELAHLVYRLERPDLAGYDEARWRATELASRILGGD